MWGSVLLKISSIDRPETLKKLTNLWWISLSRNVNIRKMFQTLPWACFDELAEYVGLFFYFIKMLHLKLLSSFLQIFSTCSFRWGSQWRRIDSAVDCK